MIVWNNGLISFPLIPLKGLAGTSHRVSSCYRQMQKDSAGLVLKVKYIPTYASIFVFTQKDRFHASCLPYRNVFISTVY